MIFAQMLTTVLVLVLVPVYYQYYGMFHFLWISDIALFLTLAALWKRSPLLLSTTLIYAFPFEVAWNFDFAAGLVTGKTLLGLADYMFESDRPLVLRLISLFHIYLFIIWIWLLFKWGYDRRGYLYATILFLITIPLTYWLTEPDKNVNWVYFIEEHNLDWMPAWLWPIVMMAVVPLVIYLPVHSLLKRFVKSARITR